MRVVQTNAVSFCYYGAVTDLFEVDGLTTTQTIKKFPFTPKTFRIEVEVLSVYDEYGNYIKDENGNRADPITMIKDWDIVKKIEKYYKL